MLHHIDRMPRCIERVLHRMDPTRHRIDRMLGRVERMLHRIDQMLRHIDRMLHRIERMKRQDCAFGTCGVAEIAKTRRKGRLRCAARGQRSLQSFSDVRGVRSPWLTP
jgi:hypothetical protein